MDVVAKYIELKAQNKEIDEQLSALETVILEEHRNDQRIKIYAGRKTVTIKEETYEKLESVGVDTDVVEKRKKKIEEFDVDVQTIIMSNPQNVDIKYSKESIRIAKEK